MTSVQSTAVEPRTCSRHTSAGVAGHENGRTRKGKHVGNDKKKNGRKNLKTIARLENKSEMEATEDKRGER